MRYLINNFIICVLYFPCIALAENALSCMASHLDTNEMVKVKTISSLPTEKIATALTTVSSSEMAREISSH